MKDSNTSVWTQANAQQLTVALVYITSENDMQNFLRDVMTEKEIIEISARLEAARMLKSGSTYTVITTQTKLSSRTVARISNWMQNGTGGYNAVLAQATNHHVHISPARVD